ncbi:MAG: hypothetical protein NT056_06085 [Proteobacteria bacterium]|nr:hypothetical protein [Pseudomonadota bacterium]
MYPFYLLLIAGGISFLKWKWVKGLAIGILLLSFAYPLYLHYTVLRGTIWREATQVVVMNYRDGDVVGFNAGYISRIFQYYIDLNFQGRVPETYRFPYLQAGDKEVPKLKAEMDRLAATHRRLWLFQANAWDSDPYGVVVRYLVQNYTFVAQSHGDPELYIFKLK